MGWFHPNEYGKRLMPHISALLPALRASRGEYDGVSFALDSGILNAEDPYTEALRRVNELELALHRPDGSRVQTGEVSIQDVDQLLALPEMDLEEFENDDWQWYDELRDDDDPLELSTDLDAMLAPPRFDAVAPWEPEDESDAGEKVQLPQFQIHVSLDAPLRP